MPARIEADRRFIRRFLNRLQQLRRDALSADSGEVECLRQFDSMRSQIESAFGLVTKYSLQHAEFAQQCADFVESGRRFFWVRFRPDEYIKWLEQAIQAIEHSGTADEFLPWVLSHLGATQLETGDIRGAIGNSDRALTLANEQITIASGVAWAVLGVAANMRDEFDEAVTHLSSAVAAFEQLAEKERCEITLQNLGFAMFCRGDLEAADECYQRVDEFQRDLPQNLIHVAHLEHKRAMLQISLGELQPARNRLEHALASFRKVEDRRGEAKVLCDLGGLNASEGRTEDAVKNFTESMRLCGDSSHDDVKGSAALQLAELLQTAGRTDEAREPAVIARDVFRQIGNRPRESRATTVLGSLA